MPRHMEKVVLILGQPQKPAEADAKVIAKAIGVDVFMSVG